MSGAACGITVSIGVAIATESVVRAVFTGSGAVEGEQLHPPRLNRIQTTTSFRIAPPLPIEFRGLSPNGRFSSTISELALRPITKSLSRGGVQR
ncbi:MAG: hypothetical protein ABI718_18270 [Acidobacteriota bacterium]